MKSAIKRFIPILFVILFYIFFNDHPLFNPIFMFLSGLFLFVRYLANRNKANKYASTSELINSLIFLIISVLLFLKNLQ